MSSQNLWALVRMGSPSISPADNYTRNHGYPSLRSPRAGRRAGGLFVTSTSTAGHPRTQAPQAPRLTPAPSDRKYLLDRVDDAAIVQLYADGFSSLPLKQKTLIWHLYQAALAGRDIFIDQKHKRRARDARGDRADRRFPQGVDAATLSEIQRYTKLFWLNNGPYNNLTARKFVLNITPDQLKAAVDASAKSGAKYMTGNETSIRSWRGCSRCSSIRPSIRSSRTRHPAPARTSCKRAPTTSTPASRWRT